MNRIVSLYLTYTIITLYAIVVTMISLLLPYISLTFNLSLSQSGILFTANFVGFVSLILIGGILSDKLSKKVVLTIALAGLSIALLLFPFSPTIQIAWLAMFFMGGFGGMIQSISNAVIAGLYPQKSTFYISMSQVFFGIGALVGPVIVGTIVSSGVSWQSFYHVLGVLFLMLTIGFSINKLPGSSQETAKISVGSFARLITDVRLLLICLCLLFYTGSEIGGWGWLSTFLIHNMHFSPIKSSIAVGVFWASMTIGRFICSNLTKKMETGQLIVILSFLACIVTFLAGIVSNQYATFVLIVFMGLAYSGIWPLLVAYGCSKHQRNQGTVSALLIGSGGLGAAIIPLVMGIIAQNFSIRLAMISPALLFLLIGSIIGGISRNWDKGQLTSNNTQ